MLAAESNARPPPLAGCSSCRLDEQLHRTEIDDFGVHGRGNRLSAWTGEQGTPVNIATDHIWDGDRVKDQRVAFYMHDLSGGGVERMRLALIS